MQKDPALQLATHYAKLMDDKRFDLLHEALAEDIVIAAPEFECVGRAAFADHCAKVLSKFSATMHLIGNQNGDWNGEAYNGETYCVATHIYEEEGIARKWEVGIRYQDTIGKIDGEFKYSRRYLNIVWQADTPLQG